MLLRAATAAKAARRAAGEESEEEAPLPELPMPRTKPREELGGKQPGEQKRKQMKGFWDDFGGSKNRTILMRRVPGSDIFSVILYMSSEEEQSPIPQLFGRIAHIGLRNLACAIPRIAQPVGLRNSACATTPRWLDCATLQLHFLQAIPDPIELENDTCHPQEQDVMKIPTPMEFQTDLECPRSRRYQNSHPRDPHGPFRVSQ